jgi:hypothetical protein
MTRSLIAISILFLSACGVNQEKTYRVYDVTDASGKTYRNLNHSGGDVFIDYDGNQYIFNGNYTVITRKVSGEQFLREVQHREKP